MCTYNDDIYSYELLHYDDEFYENSIHYDIVSKIEEFKTVTRSCHIQPRNPFKIYTKPLQLVQYMYLMQKPEHATTGLIMKLLKAIRAVTLFITNRNGQFCGDILTNPKVCVRLCMHLRSHTYIYIYIYIYICIF